jgi:hypothetical protein
MAYYEDFSIDQGTDVAIQLELVDKDTGSAKDLTNHTVAAQMKHNYEADSAISFGAIVVDPATSGSILLNLTNQQTDALDFKRRYVYDVELSHVDSDSNVIIERILEGKISINPAVTE